ncbi:MAG: SCO family protein [Planctomycetota bacterium]|nr:SCO family protein [Planctomycetota bacterium]
MRRTVLGILLAGAVAMSGPSSVRAQVQATDEGMNFYQTPSQIRGLDVVENIGRTLPMELTFTDHEGKVVRLGDYFGANAKPAVVTLVYYNCPVVCDVLLTKQTEVFEKLDYSVGKEFTALSFSFDPRETPPQARTAREAYMSSYGRRGEPGVEGGWRFHVGEDSNNRALAEALGFQYRKLGDGNYSHPVCQFIITPDGRVSRYLYGYPSDVRDLKLALIDASEGKLVRTIGERFLSFCYEFDVSSGKYSLRVYRVLQLGGAVTVITLGSVIGAFMLAERSRRRRGGGGSGPGGAPSETGNEDGPHAVGPTGYAR